MLCPMRKSISNWRRTSHVSLDITHQTVWTCSVHNKTFCTLKQNQILHLMLFFYQSANICAHFTHTTVITRGIMPCYGQQLVQLFYLQQQLDPLDRSDSCFGEGSGNTTGHKVLHETNHRVRHGWMFLVQVWDPWLFQTLTASSR